MIAIIEQASLLLMRARIAKSACCDYGATKGKTKAAPCWACGDRALNASLPRDCRRD